MGKAVKILLAIALTLSLGFFALGYYSAQEAGLDLQELGSLVQQNLQELNINPVSKEYSEVQESVTIIDQGDKGSLVVSNTFLNLEFRQGDELKIQLFGDVSSKLDRLVTWRSSGDTLYIEFARAFNENPTSTGLRAIISLPADFQERLKVTSISGDIALYDVSLQSLDLETKSGGITVALPQVDEANLLSQSGDIVLSSGSYPRLKVKSGDGDIRIHCGPVGGELRSAAGDVLAELSQLSDDLKIRTVSGDIVLYQGQADFDYTLDSASGNIDLDGAPAKGPRAGIAGSGGYLLSLSTTSGNIQFESEE